MLRFIGNFFLWILFGPFWLMWMLIKALKSN
jgi:hypothetical protein